MKTLSIYISALLLVAPYAQSAQGPIVVPRVSTGSDIYTFSAQGDNLVVRQQPTKGSKFRPIIQGAEPVSLPRFRSYDISIDPDGRMSLNDVGPADRCTRIREIKNSRLAPQVSMAGIDRYEWAYGSIGSIDTTGKLVVTTKIPSRRFAYNQCILDDTDGGDFSITTYVSLHETRPKEPWEL